MENLFDFKDPFDSFTDDAYTGKNGMYLHDETGRLLCCHYVPTNSTHP